MTRTAREMVWAYEGHEFAEWGRLSALLCLLANVNRDPSQKPTPYIPQDFFMRPGEQRAARPGLLTKESFRAMRGAFIKPRP